MLWPFVIITSVTQFPTGTILNVAEVGQQTQPSENYLNYKTDLIIISWFKEENQGLAFILFWGGINWAHHTEIISGYYYYFFSIMKIKTIFTTFVFTLFVDIQIHTCLLSNVNLTLLSTLSFL